MRRVLVVSVALVGGCFTELPAMPGTGSDGTTTTTGSGDTSSATSGTTGTGAPTGSGAGSGTAGTTDGDLPTTGTTTGEPAPEGLFACVDVPGCALWDCTGACDAADPAGACVLAALRDRMVTDALEIARCDKDCAVHVLLPRGSGADEVRWQSQLQGEPATLSEARQCALKSAQFFADCLVNFGPDCSDPAAWVTDCVTVAPMCIN